MKLIVEISDKDYRRLKKNKLTSAIIISKHISDAIKNGIPLTEAINDFKTELKDCHKKMSGCFYTNGTHHCDRWTVFELLNDALIELGVDPNTLNDWAGVD